MPNCHKGDSDSVCANGARSLIASEWDPHILYRVAISGCGKYKYTQKSVHL